MISPPPTIRLKQDQVFGWHTCVEASAVDEIVAGLTGQGLEFTLDYAGAERLAVPGRRTIVFEGEASKVREICERRGWVVEIAAGFPPDLPYPPPLDRLLEAGVVESDEAAAQNLVTWGLTAEHIPDLIRMATDPELQAAPESGTACAAPLHAMHVLSELRSEAAIAPLLGEIRRINVETNFVLARAIAATLAAIGPVSLPPLRAYLADESKGLWARVTAADCISTLAKRHPDLRLRCVEALSGQLASHLVQDIQLNDTLVSDLIDLRAIEAARLLEEVFAGGRVDEFANGDWEDVQIELGLKQRRERARKPNQFIEMGRELREAFDMPELLEDEFGNLLPAVVPSLSPPAPAMSRAAVPASGAKPAPFRAPPHVGRNDRCPCGSGKKYKKCCGP